ncbi:unnamed protein product [Rangifer tarandus platyrhynchus]|uniref:Uncharacterized protein n=1 Tax=Rangifer tarandus platyrhynchus TaxID=3082113 RepID=A0AC59YY14_RANTA
MDMTAGSHTLACLQPLAETCTIALKSSERMMAPQRKTLANTQAGIWPCPQGCNLKVAKEATGKGLKCWICEEAASHEGRRRASRSLGTASHPDRRCDCLCGWALAVLWGLCFPA